MLALSTLVSATVDFQNITPSYSKSFPREWQSALMDRLYASINEEGRLRLWKECMSIDFRRWNCVICDAGMVSKVWYRNKEYGNFDIHTLPSTVEDIDIHKFRQKYTPETRKLPRELRNCELHKNRLFSAIDLRTLPTKLITLNLSYNKLTGPIVLTRLPRSLEWLYLQCNRIRQSVFFYDRLPSQINHISLALKTNPTNCIGNICAVHSGMEVENKVRFIGIPNENIR